MAAKPRRSRWIAVDTRAQFCGLLTRLGVVLCATVVFSAHARSAGGDWFATDCPLDAGVRPHRPTPQLLRVLTRPDEVGEDAVLLRLPDGWLYAPPAVFAALEVPPPGAPLRHAGADYYPLDRVPGLRYAVDACRQVLSLDRSAVAHTTARALWRMPPAVSAVPEPGAYLQTQAQWLRSGGDNQLSALLEGGVFAPAGLGQTSALLTEHRQVLLDTRWIHDDPATLTRWSLGDGITRGGALGRSLRFGGLQWGREFSLRPDLVTFPLPAVGDAAALPSAVDVYVDGILRARETVPAGPFELTQVPVLSGAGDIQLVITDLLGRSRIVRYAFYAAPVLLRPGLSDYTVEAGFERRGYGRDTLRYGRGFAAGTWRHGIDERLTVETHVEGDDRRQVAGAGYALLLPWVGVLGGGIAQGFGDSDGGQLYTTLDRQARTWSYAAQYLASSRNYLRMGELRPQSLRRSLLRASRYLGRGASVSAGWVDNVGVDSRSRTVNLGYSQQLPGGLAISAGAAIDLRGDDNDSLLLSLAYSFTPTLSAYTAVQDVAGRSQARAGLLRNPAGELDWSARAFAETGLVDRAGLGGDYRTPQAVLHADAEDGDRDALRLGLDTGLVVLGSDIIWTRPLTGPFALVETDVAAPVRVQFENRAAGTVRAGHPLLLPNLRAYQRNRIGADEADFGIEQRLDELRREVVAPGYGGLRLRFGTDPRVARRLRLQLADGSAVPAGSDLVLADDLEPLFVGLRGETVVLVPPGRHRLQLRWTGGSCSATVELAAEDDLRQPPQTVLCLPADPDEHPAP